MNFLQGNRAWRYQTSSLRTFTAFLGFGFRFSSDMDTIDDDLPFIMNIFLSEAFEMLGTLVVLVISQPLLAVAFVPLAFMYRWIQVEPSCLLQGP